MFKVNFKNLISENNKFSYFLIFLLVQSFAFTGYVVSCGDATLLEGEEFYIDYDYWYCTEIDTGNCVEDFCADETELHEVRCCSDTQIAGYQQQNGCSVWAESQLNSYDGEYGCAWELTYAEAVAACEADGARLCTQEEVNANCTSGTGCAFNVEMIVTSTECAMPGDLNFSEGYAAGETSVTPEDGIGPSDVDAAYVTGFFEGQSTGDVNHDGELTITDIVIIIDNILND